MSTLKIQQDEDARAIAEAITAISKEIEEDPAHALTSFKATAQLQKGLRTDIQIRDFQQVSDEPESLGGNNEGPNPVEIILGAFAACQEIVIKAYASMLDIKIKNIDAEVTGNLDLRGFFNLAEVRPGYQSIHFETTIETEEEDAEKLEKLKYFAIHKCPVMDILRNPVPVDGDITFTS